MHTTRRHHPAPPTRFGTAGFDFGHALVALGLVRAVQTLALLAVLELVRLCVCARVRVRVTVRSRYRMYVCVCVRGAGEVSASE